MTEATKQPPEWFTHLARLCETISNHMGGDENVRFALFMFTPCPGCGGANDVMTATNAEDGNLARILEIEAQRLAERIVEDFSIGDVLNAHTKERCQ